MIYVLKPTLAQNIQLRLLGIIAFALLTGIGANLSLATQPVPITMQVLMVLLAGLTLGWRDGFASILTYLGLIAAGLPFAANGLGGVAAFQTPSAGYLYSFPIAAAVVGLLAVRPNVIVRWLAGMVGVAVIYLIGATYLKYNLATSWENAWLWGVEPFIVIDAAKALLAAALGEGAWQWWRHHTGR